MTAKARGVLALLCAGGLCVSIAACDGGAGGSRPAPVTSIRSGSTPLEQWRYQAAQAVTSLLAPQKSGLAVLEPTLDPSVTTELSAVLALGPDAGGAAIAPDVVASYDGKTGLFVEKGAVSDRLTWLVARWLSSGDIAAIPVPRIVDGLQKRGRALAQGRLSDDSAAAFLYVLRSLELFRTQYAGPAPAAPEICAALAAATEPSAVATWAELSVRSGASCDAAATRQRLLSDLAAPPAGRQPSLLVAVGQEYARISVQRLFGAGISKPSVCGSVLGASNPPFLPDITASTYLLCADEYRAAGMALHFSPESRARLERDILWRGRLPETIQFNSVAVVQSRYALRSLQFRDDVLQKIAGQEVISGSDLDGALIGIARGAAHFDEVAQARLVAAAAPGDLLADGMLAIVALQSGGCAPALTDRLAKSAAKNAGEKDARSLLYRAMVVKALSHCGRDDLASAARRDVLAQLTAGPPEAVNVWRVAETRCTLGEAPGVGEADVLRVLPRPGTETWTGYALFAGVRLTDLVTKGCTSTWWS